MTKIKGSNVLITGGGSGIGRIMGRIVLEKGAKSLTIWDVNEKNMTDTLAELKSKGKIYTQKVDVSNAEQVEESANMAKKNAGCIDIVINCAGIVANNNTFDKQSVSDITRTMNINATAPMLVALAFLPDMIKKDFGHVCNIASAAGMISNPRMSVYAASKWAVVGWSDSVRLELKQMKSNVHFSTLTPYYINTGMFDGVQSRFFPILKPEPTAKKIIKTIEKNKNFKGIPFGFHFIRLCQGLLPTFLFDFIFGEVVGIFHGMDNFTGRK